LSWPSPGDNGSDGIIAVAVQETPQKKEATVGFEPTNNGFAIHRLSHLATSPAHNQKLSFDFSGRVVCEA
jgi:hypothetical protein